MHLIGEYGLSETIPLLGLQMNGNLYASPGRRRRRFTSSLRLALIIAGVLTVLVGIYPTLASVFGDASRVLAAG